MPRLEPKVITGTPAAFLQGAQLWAVQTAIELLPGVFHGGPRGPTPGQQLRLAEAGYVRQETRGGRFPLVTWLTPTGQVIGNEAARGVAHDLPRAGPTPGINPTAPPAPPAAPPTEFEALIRNRTFVPKGGSDFDRLILGRTYNPPDLPARAPVNTRIGTAAGVLPSLADLLGGSILDRAIREFHERRRKGPKRRARVRSRGQPPPPTLPPPTLQVPTPATPAPPAPSFPPRRAPVSMPQPATLPPHPRPESTVAQTYRVPAPSGGSIRLPQPRSAPVSAASRPSPIRRPLLDPLVGLLGLPLLAPTSRPGLANFAPPQFSTPSVIAPPQFSAPFPRPLTQFQTQPLGSTSDCSCGPKPTRTRTKKCTNPIVSTRKRGDLIITTRRLECP